MSIVHVKHRKFETSIFQFDFGCLGYLFTYYFKYKQQQQQK